MIPEKDKDIFRISPEFDDMKIIKKNSITNNNSYYKKEEDDDISKKKKKDKKKKKKKKLGHYDYSEFNYDGDMRVLLKQLAKSIKGYIKYVEVYAIFDGMTDKEWNEQMKLAKKLIKKLKKGDPSPLDPEVFNELMESNHKLIIGMDN